MSKPDIDKAPTAEPTRKPRIRVWTSGLEMDATVKATMQRKCIGSGFAFGKCARDMDFEYDTEAERDAEFERVRPVFSNAIRMERL